MTGAAATAAAAAVDAQDFIVIHFDELHVKMHSHHRRNHWRPPRRGCRGHIPQYFGWGDVNKNIPPILLRTFGYSRPILVALRSLSLKPISFGYKTPLIRFSQAGG